jgi:hypothetical protein
VTAAAWGLSSAMVFAVAAFVFFGAVVVLEPEDFRPAVADICDDAVHTCSDAQ